LCGAPFLLLLRVGVLEIPPAVLADEVAELFAFGFEIALEGGFGGDGGVDAFGDLDARLLEGGDLFRVVGDEADGGNVELLEDGGGKLEGAEVGGEAEFVVGFDGVETLVLELVSAKFGHEADAAAFLLLVEEDAGAFVGDALEGEVELVVAVAAQRVKDVAGEALGVDADDGRLAMDIAHDEGDGAFDRFARGIAGLRDAFEAKDAKLTPAGGEVGVSDFGEAEKRHSLRLDEWGAGRMRGCGA
jgi:hypothetical protein